MDLMPKAFSTSLPLGGAEMIETVHNIFVRALNVIQKLLNIK